MLRELLKNTKFKYKISDFFNKNKEDILDIILFGSSARGKEKPGDIDILILYKTKKNIDSSYRLRKEIEKNRYNIEVTDKTYKELFDESFKAREAILSEGYSLVFNRFLSEGLGYLTLALFKYELKGFNKSTRMRFYYSLYGRGEGQKGMLNELNLIKFSDTILLCPIEKTERMKEYLESWKINFINFPVMIPSRLSNLL